jgi:hypothetical protein
VRVGVLKYRYTAPKDEAVDAVHVHVVSRRGRARDSIRVLVGPPTYVGELEVQHAGETERCWNVVNAVTLRATLEPFRWGETYVGVRRTSGQWTQSQRWVCGGEPPDPPCEMTGAPRDDLVLWFERESDERYRVSIWGYPSWIFPTDACPSHIYGGHSLNGPPAEGTVSARVIGADRVLVVMSFDSAGNPLAVGRHRSSGTWL